MRQSVGTKENPLSLENRTKKAAVALQLRKKQIYKENHKPALALGRTYVCNKVKWSDSFKQSGQTSSSNI